MFTSPPNLELLIDQYLTSSQKYLQLKPKIVDKDYSNKSSTNIDLKTKIKLNNPTPIGKRKKLENDSRVSVSPTASFGGFLSRDSEAEQ